MQTRAGSIIEGAPQPTPAQAEEYYIEGDTQLGDVPGSERIVSVSDRVAEPATAPTETARIAEGSSTTSSTPHSKTLPATGWTARRSIPEMRR